MKKRTWEQFRESGMLWWINMILHTFGWAIVVEVDENRKTKNCYPARVKLRGFTDRINSEGYEKVANYIKDNAKDIYLEAAEK